jgi:predicted DNA-binding protein YlxM (UPF0122 family)
MTTKRYLEQIERIEKLIRNKQLELEKLRYLCGVQGISYDKERVQSSSISDTTGRMGTELAAIRKQIDYWFEKRKKIISQIESIDDVATYEILSYRYIQQMSVFDMAEQFEITENMVWKRLKKAHKAFEKLYGEEYLD